MVMNAANDIKTNDSLETDTVRLHADAFVDVSYVKPLEGFQAGDRLQTIYYINGAFYTNDMGIEIPQVSMSLREHKADFAEGATTTPW